MINFRGTWEGVAGCFKGFFLFFLFSFLFLFIIFYSTLFLIQHSMIFVCAVERSEVYRASDWATITFGPTPVKIVVSLDHTVVGNQKTWITVGRSVERRNQT